jgi:hypothetical protein
MRHALPALFLAASLLLACDKLKGLSGKGGPSATTDAPSPKPGSGSGGQVVEVTDPKLAFEFNGSYTKYAESVVRNGQRTQTSMGQNRGTLVIAGGTATYTQVYPEKGKDVHVTQIYSFKPDDVRTVGGGFDVSLTFVKMDSDTTNYRPDDRSPKIQARRIQPQGFQIGLLTTDSSGTWAGAEFR